MIMICLHSFSQDSIQQVNNNNQYIKSIVVQKIDSLQDSKIDKIELNLTQFHHETRRSQFFMYVGTMLTLYGAFNQPSNNKPNYLLFAGCLSNFIGGVIYLDSFKYLNFKHKIPGKKVHFDVD